MPSRAGLRHLPDDPRTFSCPCVETWHALHLVPCSTSLRRGKKRLELGLNHESGPIGAPVRWAPDSSPMGVIGPHQAPSNSRSDGLLCLMRADAARCAILAEADAGRRGVIVAKQIRTTMPQCGSASVWRQVHVARSRCIVCWSRVRPLEPPSIRQLEWNTAGTGRA